MYNYFEIKSFFLSGSEGLPGSPGVKTSPSHAGGAGSLVGIPGWIPRGMPDWREKIPHASWAKHQNIKQKQYCNTFHKDFKIDPQQKALKKKKKFSRVKTPKVKKFGEYLYLFILLIFSFLCMHKMM